MEIVNKVREAQMWYEFMKQIVKWEIMVLIRLKAWRKGTRRR